MRRKYLVAGLLVLAVLALGAYVLARRVLGSDLVRSALEQQLATRLGQPVHIRAASAALFPRVAVSLDDVLIGAPAAVHLGQVRIVTGWGGLFSRTIADAEVVVANTTVALPLPFSIIPAGSPQAGADAGGNTSPGEAGVAFTLTSIRVISLRDVAFVSGNHTLRVDLDSSIDGDRLQIARLTTRAKTTRIDATGEFTSLARREGRLDAKANPLDLDEMIAVASALTSTAPGGSPGTRARATGEMHVSITMTAPAGQFDAYPFRDLKTTVDVVPGRLALAPLSVRMFGGSLEGRLDEDTARPAPQTRLTGRVDGLDVNELMKTSGSPGSITGRLGGTVSLIADGADAPTLMRTARGTIAAAITNGKMPGLDMVRTIVFAFGKPSGAPAPGAGSAFSRLGGTLSLANGALTSDNLAFASRDFDMQGRGALKMATGSVDARADVVLSGDLTAQSGADLRRYTQQNGRVTVPATISGTIARPNVSLDVGAATRRALENELQRRAGSFLDGLLIKKKGGGG